MGYWRRFFLGPKTDRSVCLLLMLTALLHGSEIGTVQHAVELNNLAQTRRSEGRDQEALRMFREALRILDSIPDAPAIERAAVMNNLGVALGESGRFSEGQRLLERSLEMKVRLFGVEHEQVRFTRENIAKLRASVGSRKRGVGQVVDAMELRRVH